MAAKVLAEAQAEAEDDDSEDDSDSDSDGDSDQKREKKGQPAMESESALSAPEGQGKSRSSSNRKNDPPLGSLWPGLTWEESSRSAWHAEAVFHRHVLPDAIGISREPLV